MNVIHLALNFISEFLNLILKNKFDFIDVNIINLLKLQIFGFAYINLLIAQQGS